MCFKAIFDFLLNHWYQVNGVKQPMGKEDVGTHPLHPFPTGPALSC